MAIGRRSLKEGLFAQEKKMVKNVWEMRQEIERSKDWTVCTITWSP